ncbi:unnamed protein product [Orchesella dallaii]|uniref:Glycosyl hydrolases family 22 (GH22) domain-containing protein n=1 Tax=Orchesella dallaii TaxID=48710 RepID=A0ABP1RAX0_9HEXA
MEEHQELVITRNLGKLIQETRLNTHIYTSFTSKDILTWAECDDLETIPSEQKRCMEFYKIIKTRTGAYDTLINTLKECNQSGAVKILESSVATIEVKEFQQSLSGVCMCFKQPEWRDKIRRIMDSKEKLTIESMSAAITRSRVNSIIPESIWVKAEEARSRGFLFKIEPVYKQNLNVKLLLIEGPDVDNSYDMIHKRCRDVPVIFFEPMQDFKTATPDLVQDLVSWNDVLDHDKRKAMNNLVEFQVPNKIVVFSELNEQFGGDVKDLEKYLYNISKIVKDKLQYKLNYWFVSFLEGKVPKICTLKCDQLYSSDIKRHFTCERLMLNKSKLTSSSNVLLVISGATFGQLSNWNFEPDEVKQMPIEHDSSIRVLVLELAPHKNQLAQFETICERERNLMSRRVAWFQLDGEHDDFLLVKDVESSTTPSTAEASSFLSVVNFLFDEETLLKESNNVGTNVICLEGDRGIGMTSVINSLVEKVANIDNKYFLTCRLSMKDFVNHLTYSHATDYFSEFVNYVWCESCCCELIKTWLEKSSKKSNLICNVFIDDFCKIENNEIGLVQDIVKMFMNEKSIRVWICGSSGAFKSLQLETPSSLLTYKLSRLVEGEIKRLLVTHINNKCEKLVPNVDEFLDNWKVITRDQNLIVLGHPQSIINLVEYHENIINIYNKSRFDYFLIGVVYHDLILANWCEKHNNREETIDDSHLTFKPFLDAIFIISPESALVQQNSNCEKSREIKRKALVENLHNNPVSMFFINCLIAYQEKIEVSITKNNIGQFTKFISIFPAKNSATRHALLHSCTLSGLYHLAHLLISCDFELNESQYRMTLHMAANHVNQNLNKHVHYALSERNNEWCNSETPCYCSTTIERLKKALEVVNQVNQNAWELTRHNYFYARALSSMPLNGFQASWVNRQVKKLSYPDLGYHQNQTRNQGLKTGTSEPIMSGVFAIVSLTIVALFVSFFSERFFSVPAAET